MTKLIWTYTVAALLAFNSGFAFAGHSSSQVSPKGPGAKENIMELLQKSESATFEEISSLQSRLDSIRRQIKSDKVDGDTYRHIDVIQTRIDTLVSILARSMNTKAEQSPITTVTSRPLWTASWPQ